MEHLHQEEDLVRDWAVGGVDWYRTRLRRSRNYLLQGCSCGLRVKVEVAGEVGERRIWEDSSRLGAYEHVRRRWMCNGRVDK
jgi:hypothetical protein